MRLKSLELKGFKSFSNETHIHFDENVIGIVGPNGSGKSNIVDAIRWVLGEQKGKELRLENMGDVIFNGTKKKKAGNLAQVSITFENTKNLLPTEFQTVTISRLLYRSGESEYRLNGVTCRLKDIHSLLLDTGIGSNSYAIIALGMVDDILSDKENARRRMFEQAAGISKYKKRKHETMLRLKSTTADLDRIEDLLFEIETNLKSLEKQARRTKRFVDVKQQYKEYSINLAIRKSSQLRSHHTELEKQIQMEKDTYLQLEARLKKREAELEHVKKSNLDEEKQLSDSQRELNMLVGKVRNLESEKGLKEQKIVFLQESQRKLQNQIDSGQVKATRLAEELEQTRSMMVTSSRELDSLSEKMGIDKEEKERVEAQYREAQANRSQLGSSRQALEKEFLELQKKQLTLHAQIVQSEENEKQQNAEITSLAKEINEFKESLAIVDKERQKLADAIKVNEEKEEDRKKKIEQEEQSLNNLKDQLQGIQRKLDAKKNEQNLLREMISKLEGFPESVRFLSKSDDWSSKAVLLSDILQCDPDYRVQLEHLLEPWLNHFVVENMEEAMVAVNLLNKSQKGKANFFILDQVKEQHTATQQNLPHAEPALKYVKTEDKYQALLQLLLGDVFVTEKSPADPVYKEAQYKDAVLMDSQGTLFRRAYSISGGSIGLFEGKKIGRKANLAKLEKEIKQLEIDQKKSLDKIEDSRNELQVLRNLEDKILLDDLKRTHRQVDQKYIEVNATLQHKSDRVEKLDTGSKLALKNMEEARKTLSEVVARLDKKEKELHSTQTLFDDADKDFNALLKSVADASATYNSSHISFVQARGRTENLEKEMKLREEQIAEIEKNRLSDQEQKEEEVVEIGKIQREMEEISSSLIDLYSDKKAKEQALGTAEQEYFKARNEIHQLEDKIKGINRELQNSQYLINQLKDEFNDAKFKVTSLAERLDIEFHVKLEDVLKGEVDESVELEELEDRVEKLRHRIENFGEINPMAVEAYDEMKERYDTINDQKMDILQAKESLMETIKEIEETATKQFLEAFAKVREYFIQVFRSLFTEDDNCDLILDNPDDPLESTISIIAKPKGKRPKSLSQLSGGEKTLTATAVLFALYLLKPAPFCIFDEVDAPLDDVNIEKFNKIIKKFSSQSQFIIVTHNKQTMAAVDIIYGVYMEEQGVSGLSQVDLRAFEHEALQPALN